MKVSLIFRRQKAESDKNYRDKMTEKEDQWQAKVREKESEWKADLDTAIRLAKAKEEELKDSLKQAAIINTNMQRTIELQVQEQEQEHTHANAQHNKEHEEHERAALESLRSALTAEADERLARAAEEREIAVTAAAAEHEIAVTAAVEEAFAAATAAAEREHEHHLALAEAARGLERQELEHEMVRVRQGCHEELMELSQALEDSRQEQEQEQGY